MFPCQYNGFCIILLFQRRYTNRPIVELEAAAQEELKITELRLTKLFSLEPTVPSTTIEGPTVQSDKAAGINPLYPFVGYKKMSSFFTLHVCEFCCIYLIFFMHFQCQMSTHTIAYYEHH
jgi:hypothetical protein